MIVARSAPVEVVYRHEPGWHVVRVGRNTVRSTRFADPAYTPPTVQSAFVQPAYRGPCTYFAHADYTGVADTCEILVTDTHVRVTPVAGPTSYIVLYTDRYVVQHHGDIPVVGRATLRQKKKASQKTRRQPARIPEIRKEVKKAAERLKKDDPNLTELNLGGRKISALGFKLLAESMKDNKHLKNLLIYNTDVTYEAMCALRDNLKDNYHIKSINFGENYLKAETVQVLIELLKENPSINSIYLDWHVTNGDVYKEIKTLLMPENRRKLWIEKTGSVPDDALKQTGHHGGFRSARVDRKKPRAKSAKKPRARRVKSAKKPPIEKAKSVEKAAENRKSRRLAGLDVQLPIPDNISAIGTGVEVKQSTIPDAGNGLFATKPYRSGERVTWYDGVLISREEAMLKTGESTSHLCSRGLNADVIDGLRIPTPGRGGASFANASESPNASIVREYPYVFLVANKDIRSGQEITTTYGNDYWHRVQEAPAQTGGDQSVEKAAENSITFEDHGGEFEYTYDAEKKHLFIKTNIGYLYDDKTKCRVDGGKKIEPEHSMFNHIRPDTISIEMGPEECGDINGPLYYLLSEYTLVNNPKIKIFIENREMAVTHTLDWFCENNDIPKNNILMYVPEDSIALLREEINFKRCEYIKYTAENKQWALGDVLDHF